MKRVHIFGIFLLFWGGLSLGWSSAQTRPGRQLFNAEDSLRQIQPVTAMIQEQRQLQEAQQANDVPQVIRHLIGHMTGQLIISRDSFPSQLSRIEQFSQDVSQPAEKALLNSLLAELYLHFYNEDAYTYNNRSRHTAATEDISQWDAALFGCKIDSLLKQSLLPAERLQQTPVEAFGAVINFGADSRELRPTLFEFLAGRAIEMYQSQLFRRLFPENRLYKSMAMAPVQEFIGDRTAFDSNDPNHRILDIYRQWLRFRSDTPLSPAFIVTDLDRLAFAGQRVEEGSKRYTETLLQKLEQYAASSPCSVDIATRLLAGYMQNETDSLLQSRIDSLLPTCKKLLAAWPRAGKSAELRQAIEAIERPFLSVDAPAFVYPDGRDSLRIFYRNLDSLLLQIYRIPADKSAPDDPFAECLPHRLVYSETQHPSGYRTPVEREVRYRLPLAEPGQYIIKSTSLDIPSDSACAVLHVTRLLSAFTRTGEDETVFVADARSGKPISKATVLLYNSLRYDSIEYIGSCTTDKNGTARFSASEITRYRIVFRNDTCPLSPRSYPKQEYTPKDTHLALFTDRNLYRPGQTVQFTGFCYRFGKEARKVLPGEKVTLSLTRRGEPISTIETVTDDFGAFSGEFVLPGHILSGWLAIEGNFPGGSSAASFEVAEYKRPTFRIDFGKNAETDGFGQPATLKGRVSRYSGAALAEARVEYRITRLPNWFRRLPAPRQQVAEGTLTTDEKGDFTISFVPKKPEENAFDTGISYLYQVSVAVTASNGETQENDFTFPVSDSPIGISITLPDLIDRTQPIPLGIQITDSRPTGQPVECRYILYSLYPSDTPQEIYQLRQNGIRTQVEQQEFTGDNIPDSVHWEQLPSGAYRLLVQATDPQGKIISDQTDFVLYSPRDKRLPVNVTEWVPRERYTVRPGETARVIYGTSFPDTYVLCQLYEGKKRIETRCLKISNQVKIIDIPYKKSYSDNLTLSLLFVKEGRIYSRHIVIEREQPSPALEIISSTFRNRLTPGEQETWSFTVRDAAGNPVSARFVSDMFDASLNTFRPHDWHFAPFYPSGSPVYWQTGAESYHYRYARYHSYPYLPATGRYHYDLLKVPFSFLYRDNGDEWFAAPRLYASAAGGMSAINGMMKSSVTVADSVEETAAETDGGEETSGGTEPSYRQNFNETAFFYPRLQTDAGGEVTVRFTVPDSHTQWQFMALAFTRQLQYRIDKRTAVSSKPLMVRPNVPRFVRQGDRTALAATVENSGDSIQEGTLRFELFDPGTDRILQEESQLFILRPGESKTVSFPFVAPEEGDLAGIRVLAATTRHSDGEQHWLPVLPKQVLVTEAQRFFLYEGETDKTVEMRSFADDRSRTRKEYRMTLEYAANPIGYAIQALPALTDITANDATHIFAAYYTHMLAAGLVHACPQIASAIRQWSAGADDTGTLRSRLETHDDLKSVLLSETPWMLEAQNETEQLQQLSRLFDTNRTAALQEEALQKLQKLQNGDGGWSWREQMPSHPFITLNILYGLHRLTGGGWAKPDARISRMQTRALAYADRMALSAPRTLDSQLYYLFVRSHYRDIPLAGETLAFHREMTSALQKEWPKLPLYEKALAAVTLHRYGFADEARQIIRSLREQATTTPEQGMFWQNNRSRWSSRNSAVQVHTALMTAFAEIAPDTVELNRMKIWLLQQKLTQGWGSVPSTVDAIDILLRTGTSWSTNSGTLHLQWGDEVLPDNPADRITGYIRYTRQGKEIDSRSGKVTIQRDSRQPASGALYRQYFDNIPNIRKTDNPGLSVEKQLWVARTTPDGTKYVPLNTTAIQPGQLIEVRFVVKTGQDLEFVCLTDQRAACFEPVEQLSQYKYLENVGYLQETGDTATRLFFDFLPKGTYVFSYLVRADRSGTYGNGITTLQCLYAPQFVAHTAGGTVTVE